MTTDITDVIAQAIATAHVGDMKSAAIAAAEAFAAGVAAYEDEVTRRRELLSQPPESK